MLTYTYASIFLAGFALGIVAGTVLYQRLSRRQYERAIRDTTQELYQRVVQEGAKAIAESAKASMEDVSRETRHALELEKTEIKDMIEPVRQVLEAYRQEVSAFRSSVQQNYGEVTQMMRALEEAGRRLSEETRNLASALKNNQARGRWGEIQLRRIVEASGMLEHCDFEEQVAGEGNRPDMVIRLPGNREIVVDAKVPISEYLRALEAQSEDEAVDHLKAYSRQVRERLRELASKKYSSGPRRAEFVVMFLPGESFFSAALRFDPELMDFGIQNGVIVASPVTLLAILRSVAMSWQQFTLQQNMERVIEMGGKVYESANRFLSSFSEIGRDISRVVKKYNEGARSLRENLIPYARSMKELGVKGSEKSPEIGEVDDTVTGTD